MKLSELFGRAELNYPPELGELEIEQIVTDSRQVRVGSLFLCVKGLHTDGHGYINEAINAGAAVIVAEQVRDACVGGAAAQIVLDNTRQVAALLYHAWYGRPGDALKIIGVTGTNGKTSVCTLLCEIFEAAGYRCGIIGTVCCRSADGRPLSPKNRDETANMTTPDPEALYAMLAEMVRDRVEYVFMEVTSHALALCKADALRFDTAVFTNLTQDHLDFHQNMESYFEAKKKLFTLCRRGVILKDDPYGQRLIEAAACPIVTCSMGEGDYCALQIKGLGADGSEFLMRAPQGEIPLRIGIPGDFSVTNALLAAAVATEYGIEPAILQRTLACTSGVSGRMERVLFDDTSAPTVIIDYAHTPDALEKLLKSVRGFRQGKGRILLLFGCGGERDRGKRRQMAQIGSRLSDFVIVTSDNSRGEDPRQILSDILKGIDKEKPYLVIPDRRAAIEAAVSEAREGDILLLAGKGHERYEINRQGRVPFDEREIVKNALQKRAK